MLAHRPNSRFSDFDPNLQKQIPQELIEGANSINYATMGTTWLLLFIPSITMRRELHLLLCSLTIFFDNFANYNYANWCEFSKWPLKEMTSIILVPNNNLSQRRLPPRAQQWRWWWWRRRWRRRPLDRARARAIAIAHVTSQHRRSRASAPSPCAARNPTSHRHVMPSRTCNADYPHAGGRVGGGSSSGGASRDDITTRSAAAPRSASARQAQGKRRRSS